MDAGWSKRGDVIILEEIPCPLVKYPVVTTETRSLSLVGMCSASSGHSSLPFDTPAPPEAHYVAPSTAPFRKHLGDADFMLETLKTVRIIKVR